ncbi:protein FAM161A [Elgaria multicarinata webbii]|uniref:protein FAM161A n=1 Tax=Elgaria multicarinata webbii TaxID=159646 RepID=UPI002FCCF5A4
MDAAHRAALHAVSCLHTPVDPRTRAPIALYEREPGRPRAAGGERQDCLNPEREQSCTNDDTEDWIDLSKMYLSNQEYYLKLEELKHAHLETMAKLENMYQNKLYLKGVQPLVNMDVTHNTSFRSTWETNSFHLQNIRKSFSEPDLNNSFCSYLSDMSDKELELEENDSECGSLTFGLEQIENAWDGCSLEDYSHCTRSITSKLLPLKKSRRKKKKWTPKITVPEPFQMTIREAKKKQQNTKSKSLIELENNLLKKQLEEEAECQKKFRANPVPGYVFVPLYQEIMQQNEERRKSLRERRRAILLATQKPFQFIEREAQKKEMRKMQLKDLSSPEKKAKVFKAKPVPKFVYSSEISEKQKEEELYRDLRIQMRSEELLRNSSLPNTRLGSRGTNKHRQQDHLEHSEESECKLKTKAKVPDFETLHKKFQNQLQRQKKVKHITVCEPFNLCTANIPSNKERILEDIQTDEENLKETRWPYASSRCNPQMRSLNAHSSRLGCDESSSPRITESTRKRLQAIRESTEGKKKVEEEQKRRRAKQKQRARKLQRLITTRAEANDPHQSLAQMYKSKLKIYRKHEKQRMRDYLQELEEIEERVEKRPLLLEQATQKNARIAAEKHYSDILREMGLCEEFVSMKGQTAPEMLLPDHSSDGSEGLASDGGSDDENKIEERESLGEEEKSQGEEKSQLQSAQSYEYLHLEPAVVTLDWLLTAIAEHSSYMQLAFDKPLIV